MIAVEAAAERQKQAVIRDQRLAYNIASMSGAAFAGKLKAFAEHFPPLDDAEPVGMSPEGAKVLGALFRLRKQGVAMRVEKISLH